MRAATSWLGRLGRVSLLLSLWLSLIPAAPALAAPPAADRFQEFAPIVAALAGEPTVVEQAGRAERGEGSGGGSSPDAGAAPEWAAMAPPPRAAAAHRCPPARAPPAAGGHGPFQARAPPRV